jgi:hypothetical protein
LEPKFGVRENEALLHARPGQKTAVLGAVRFLGGSRTEPGPWFRFQPGPRPGNPEPLLTLDVNEVLFERRQHWFKMVLLLETLMKCTLRWKQADDAASWRQC